MKKSIIKTYQKKKRKMYVILEKDQATAYIYLKHLFYIIYPMFLDISL